MKTLKAHTVIDDENIGAWHIESADCPLDFHGMRPQCVVGIVTNMQGPVPLNFCKHCNKDGNFDGLLGVQVECSAPPRQKSALDKIEAENEALGLERCPNTGELFGGESLCKTD